MPRDADIPEISQIFLSATAEDCKAYRKAVRDNLQLQFRAVKIFLQEEWSEAGQLTVEVCRDRVKTSDGYIGLFGYRYGWQPPGHTVSITEMEFRWALERWPKAPSPVCIMLPLKDSAAARKLLAAAQPLLAKEFPVAADREAAERRRLDFIASVRRWADEQVLMLEFFGSRQELERKTAGAVNAWDRRLVRLAPQGRRVNTGEIPAENLGRIGRRDQIVKLQDALEAFDDRKGERAVAFLVHGPQNHGQRQFAEFLAHWDRWNDMEKAVGQAPDAGSTASQADWLCAELGEPVPGGAGIEGLAALLAARLARSSVLVVLRWIGDRPDRLATFQGGFWRPLRAALARRKPGGSGRLYCFVVDQEALPADPGPAVAVQDIDDAGQDCAQLLALPALAPITRAQVRSWLKEIADPEIGVVLDDVRRDAIAEFATRQGGYPPDIYDRLALDGFWAGRQ